MPTVKIQTIGTIGPMDSLRRRAQRSAVPVCHHRLAVITSRLPAKFIDCPFQKLIVHFGNAYMYDAASQNPPQRVWVYRYRAMGIQELCSPPPPVGGWGGVVVVSWTCIPHLYMCVYPQGINIWWFRPKRMSEPTKMLCIARYSQRCITTNIFNIVQNAAFRNLSSPALSHFAELFEVHLLLPHQTTRPVARWNCLRKSELSETNMGLTVP